MRKGEQPNPLRKDKTWDSPSFAKATEGKLRKSARNAEKKTDRVSREKVQKAQKINHKYYLRVSNDSV
jgi:hypothetical protein